MSLLLLLLLLLLTSAASSVPAAPAAVVKSHCCRLRCRRAKRFRLCWARTWGVEDMGAAGVKTRRRGG